MIICWGRNLSVFGERVYDRVRIDLLEAWYLFSIFGLSDFTKHDLFNDDFKMSAYFGGLLSIDLFGMHFVKNWSRFDSKWFREII